MRRTVNDSRSYLSPEILIYAISIICFLVNCNTVFEYSPYQVKGDGKLRNQDAIASLVPSSEQYFIPFRIALISDSHTHYDKFEDQINALNQIDSVSFIVHLGDITLSGIYREFLWYTNLIAKLKKPVITVIGNHDVLSNGEAMYRELFGDCRFSFVFNNCQIVVWDDIIWERNNKALDFQWLVNTISDSNSYTYRLVFAHIPPWDGQFSIENRYLYNQIMTKNGVAMSIHGHLHDFQYIKISEVPYLVVGPAKDREIVLLDILQDTILFQRRFY